MLFAPIISFPAWPAKPVYHWWLLFVSSNNVSISNKVKTILSKIGLLDRLTDGDLNFSKLYSSEIDYDLVSDKLDPLIKESKNYLLGALTKWLKKL